MLEASTIFWKKNWHQFLGIWEIQNNKETSQHAYQFYEKMGFELEKIEKEYWAKNFDLYIMQTRNNINT